jgi:hypothetical protein
MFILHFYKTYIYIYIYIYIYHILNLHYITNKNLHYMKCRIYMTYDIQNLHYSI